MTHTNFNIDEFTSNLTGQVKDVIPSDITQETVDFMINTMDNFLHLAYEALRQDYQLDLSEEQYSFLLQVLAEWIVHKSIDLSRAKVTSELWDTVMQHIAFTIFEIVKESFKKEVPQDDIVNIVESHVNNAYKHSLQELFDKNRITKEILEAAIAESNIDKMAEEYRSIEQENIIDETPKSTIKKKQKNPIQINKVWTSCKQYILYLAGFILLSAGIWSYRLQIMNCITTYKDLIIPCTIGIVVLFALIGLVIYFTAKKRVEQQLKELDNIHKQMQDLVNPDKQFERLGVDILRLEIGVGLLCIADPDQDGMLLAMTAALRQELTDELGYIIPNIRICDSSELENFEYQISVRDEVVASDWVYPNKYMVLADEWDSKVGKVPENVIYGVDPALGTQCYWLDREDVENHWDNITVVDPVEVIKTHLKAVVIKYVDSILTGTDIKKYLILVNSQEESLMETILQRIELEDIRRIFASLIREQVSIKDIIFVLTRLNYYTKTIKDLIELSEMLRRDLAQQISMKHADKDRNLWVVELDKNYTKYLESNVKNTINGQIFDIPQEQINELIEMTATKLMMAHQSIGRQPVVLCSPKFRQALYSILVKYIPTVVVMSHAEVASNVKVETEEIIEYAERVV